MINYLKNTTKNSIAQDSTLYWFLTNLVHINEGFWRPQTILEDKIESIITEYLQNKLFFSFIQIGSNDGKSNDPLINFIKSKKVKGVFIEPVDYVFEELKKNHEGIPGVNFENIAISSQKGQLEFFMMKQNNDPSLPHWYNQLSSFDYNSIVRNKFIIPDIENHIEKKLIETQTYDYIIQKYQLDDLDILHMDTEGHDYEILKSIDFSKYCPKILLYENKCMSRDDYKKSIYLVKKYFRTIKQTVSGDTICLK